MCWKNLTVTSLQRKLEPTSAHWTNFFHLVDNSDRPPPDRLNNVVDHARVLALRKIRGGRAQLPGDPCNAPNC